MEKVFTNLEHAEWLREQARLKRPYWYGTYFNKCTEALLKRKANQYSVAKGYDHYVESRMPTYRKHIAAGQICGDCVNGAIKGAVWSELGKREPKYASHGCPDKSADGMFEYCKKIGMAWGKIDTMPDVIGLAVRFSQHVGVYVGNGEVVEWRGFSYGCVVTKLANRKWTHWYEIPWTDYVTGDIQATKPVTQTQSNVRPTLKKGSKGENVKLLQKNLIALNYSCGKSADDGDFGSATLKAVNKFQGDNGLKVDGIVGTKTWAALDAAVEKTPAQTKPSRFVEIKGCTTCNARSGPGTSYKILGVAKVGEKFVYGGQISENGWYLIEYKNQNAWVSGKYGKLVVE